MGGATAGEVGLELVWGNERLSAAHGVERTLHSNLRTVSAGLGLQTLPGPAPTAFQTGQRLLSRTHLLVGGEVSRSSLSETGLTLDLSLATLLLPVDTHLPPHHLLRTLVTGLQHVETRPLPGQVIPQPAHRPLPHTAVATVRAGDVE